MIIKQEELPPYKKYKDFYKLSYFHREILMKHHQDKVKRRIKIIKMDPSTRNNLLRSDI